MITIDVRTDLRRVEQYLASLQRDQIPFATAYALTQCAKAAQREVEREIPRVFDRPTPFTQRPVWTKAATKRNLQAEVKIKDYAAKGNAAVKWLIAEIRGSPRNIKGFESLLQRNCVMPKGWYAVPTQNAPLDQYGNVPGSAINAILSQLRARRELDQNETAALKKKRNSRKLRAKSRPSRYFVAFPNGNQKTAHLTPGIWERVGTGFGSAIRPVFLYVQNAPRYRKRLQFERIVQDTVQAQLPMQFKRGLLLAARTARPA